MEVTPLGIKDVKAIYSAHLQNDFPADERKPLASIIRQMRKGCYTCFALTDCDELLGYAFFVRLDRHYLLDYLAIVSGKRGQGLGSAFLKMLPDMLDHADSLIAEVDDPDCSCSPEEESIRKSRLNFYLKNGFADTLVKAETFGVSFMLLEMNRYGRHSEEEIRNIYRSHYRAFLPAFIFRKMIHV